MLRCHTSSLKGKWQNLMTSNSVAGEYLPACLLENPNVHHFLNPGKLTTPEFPKRLSLIFLWVELYRRYPIPIVNPLLIKFRIFKGDGVQTLFWLHKKNKKTDNFCNRPPILVLTCWKCDDKLKVFGKIIDECILTLIVYRHWRVFFLTWWPTYIRWRLVLLIKIENQILYHSLISF